MEVSSQLHALATLSLGKQCPVTIVQEAGVGPRASLDVNVMENRNISCPCGNWTPTPRSSSPQPSCYTDWAICIMDTSFISCCTFIWQAHTRYRRFLLIQFTCAGVNSMYSIIKETSYFFKSKTLFIQEFCGIKIHHYITFPQISWKPFLKLLGSTKHGFWTSYRKPPAITLPCNYSLPDLHTTTYTYTQTDVMWNKPF
jgi:hypothetical protein